ncbi:HD domain-containing protein [Bordetella hinzii]|uniref:HD domain-containing protein n=2 Tax=Bordetella hinzii TaxID=103855 RepID=A0AAN1VGD1_9BORD|nr:Cyclic di-GMP phosphodiesterase response regulator RpfG [Bordetella hinzii]AZW17831.1 HD domain-containing protein [Bordetella hinzii]MBZ0075807.1 HD domain-containing protein [Bordetella hinzii]MBZ0080917.1 HD domain-containing protein [Bordetella hinzii]MBZ0085322.1 HD domain-containing protein [Bordetella hinzii]
MPAAPVQAGAMGRMQGLIKALARRDPHTAGHSRRTAGIAMVLGESAGLDMAQSYVLGAAALLHDIGKLAVPIRILESRGRLDRVDWARMQGHSAMGARIVRAAALPLGEEIARAVRHHHENVDGSGYPDGLAGEEIALAARIISLADAYDAISSARSYHGERTHAQTMGILAGEVGRKCDPALFELFMREAEPRLAGRKSWPEREVAARRAIARYCAAAA